MSSTSLYTGKIKAVVSDLAGTMIDYGSCAPAGAFIALFAKHGVAATQAQARGPMGMHKREHIRAMLALPALAQQWEAANGAAADEATIDALYEEFVPMQLACLPDYGDLIPGVLDTAAELDARGIRLAATTGYNGEMMAVVLESAAAQGLVPDAAV